MVKRRNGVRYVLGLAFVTMLTMSLMTPADWAQARDAKASREGIEERMARVAKGIEPVSLGKDETPVPLDLAALMKLHNDPGLSVAVIDAYKIAWAKAYGTTESRAATPVTTKTLFQAGSASQWQPPGCWHWCRRESFRSTKT